MSQESKSNTLAEKFLNILPEFRNCFKSEIPTKIKVKDNLLYIGSNEINTKVITNWKDNYTTYKTWELEYILTQPLFGLFEKIKLSSMFTEAGEPTFKISLETEMIDDEKILHLAQRLFAAFGTETNGIPDMSAYQIYGAEQLLWSIGIDKTQHFICLPSYTNHIIMIGYWADKNSVDFYIDEIGNILSFNDLGINPEILN